MKKIFYILFIVSVLFGVTYLEVKSNDESVIPIELADPDKILIEWMDTNFYLIINDEKIKNNVEQFVVSFFNNKEKSITIPYNWEDVVEIPFKLPILISNNNMPVSIEGQYRDTFSNELRRYFLYQHSFHIYSKYPTSTYPTEVASQYEQQIIDDNYKYRIWSNWYSVHISNYRWLPASSYNFQWRSTYKSFEMYNKENSWLKKYVEDAIKNTRYESTYDIVADETESTDPNIEKISYAIWCNYETYSESDIYYKCWARVIAWIKQTDIIKNPDNNIRTYEFLASVDSRWTPDETNADRSKFMRELEVFAKNILLTDPTWLEYEEKKGSLFKYWTFYSTDTKTDFTWLSHSDTYNKIMEWEKPEIEEKPKKKEIVSKKTFQLKFRSWIKTEILNTWILNANAEKATVPLIVDIEWKAYDLDWKRIEDIEDEELFKDLKMVCSMSFLESQLWFKRWTEIVKNDVITVEENIESCDVISRWPSFYAWLYKPYEYVDVYLVDKADRVVSNKIRHKIEVIDASPEIELESRNVKIQDSNDSVFKFKIVDKYHDDFKCRLKYPEDTFRKYKLPWIKISDKWTWTWENQIEFDCKKGELISIRVTPPKLSNFDVLWELNGLSMVELQKNTAITLAWDLVWYGVEERLKKLESTKKSLNIVYGKNVPKWGQILWKMNEYEKTLRTLNRANDMAWKAQDAIKVAQIKQNIDSHAKDTEAMTEEVQWKWTMESIADAWVWWINVLQSTVWAVAMAPKYIPVLWDTVVWKVWTKITWKFTLVFNLMTNVWKWNFEYISKSEKIDRAKEKSIPYPVIIEVVAKDNLYTKDVQIVNVLYTWLDK